MRILFVSAILVFADQITKGMVRSTMSLYESIPVITDFFHITYVTNDGMAFGLNFPFGIRSEEHTSELQSRTNLVCRLLLEKKKKHIFSPA